MKKIFTFFFAILAATSMMAEDYYVTGNEALIGNKEKAWKADAIKLTEGAHTFASVAAGTECQLKVTNGTWDKNWGFSNLDTEKSSEGIYGNGDNNICFKVATTCDVVVSFDGTKVTVTGNFGSAPVLENKTVYYVNSTAWANVYMHAWGGEATGTNWNDCPAGVKESYQLKGFDVYSFTQKGAYGSCLFKDAAGQPTNQTADIVYEAGKYYYDGAWKTREELEQEGPGPEPGPEATIRVRIDSSADDWKFDEEGRGVYFYVWTIGAGTFNEATYEDGWYSYTSATTPFNFIVVNTSTWTEYASLQSVNMEGVTESACYLVKAGERIEGDGPSWNCVLEVADCNAPTAIESTAIKAAAKKVVENGQIVIIRDGVRFNIVGAQL